MKNLLITLFLCLAVLSVNAQNEDYKMTGGIHAGYSLTGAVIKLIGDTPGTDVTAKAIPAMQLTFDYGLSKMFSLGIAISYQTVSIDATDYTYVNSDGYSSTESFTTKFQRSQFALRPLFHYANNDKLDLYSGFRVGILSRGFSDFKSESGADLDDTIFSDLSLGTGSRFSLGITAFGLRYYFTENIGAGMEINLGAPYIVNVGVSARL